MSEMSRVVSQHGLIAVAAVLLVLCALAYEGGHRLGRLRARHWPLADSEVAGVGTIAAGMLALLAFTLGLSISIAQSRYEARRSLVVEEANAIGTAWLQAKTISAPEGAAIAAALEDYARVRLAYITLGQDSTPVQAALARTNSLQNAIWRAATTLVQRTPNPVTATLMSSLNQTFDMALAQQFAYRGRVPNAIALMLIGGSLLSVGALGFETGLTGRRQLILTVMLLVMWAGAMVVIADLGDPRIGTIRPDPSPLIWTIQGFSSPPAQHQD